MRSHKTGKICDGLYYLGRKETGVYWLEGNDSAFIISGGMSYIVPDVVQQIKDFQLDEEKLKGLLILHAHFDHVGIIPFLKRLSRQYAYLKDEIVNGVWSALTKK